MTGFFYVSFFKKIWDYWAIGCLADCKSVVERYVGSNPADPTNTIRSVRLCWFEDNALSRHKDGIVTRTDHKIKKNIFLV
jgi:hypothetical protein